MKRLIVANLVLLLCAVSARAQSNQTTYTLSSFPEIPPSPSGATFSYASGLLRGSDGNFYGMFNVIATTSIGSRTTFLYGGQIYRVSPDGTRTTVADLPAVGPSDNLLGWGPYSGLVEDSNGNFYGTTYTHGATNDTLCGMIYRLTPNGSVVPLYYFSCGLDGAKPRAALIAGPDGNFYGTTSAGGIGGNGTIFSISPDGAFRVIYSFSGGSDGAHSFAPLLLGSDGNFYGTTSAGGDRGGGTVFRLTPTGQLTPLFSFAASDGASPFAAGLAQGPDGSLYGRTINPTTRSGAIFKLGMDGTFTSLVSFPGNTETEISSDALVLSSDGNLYGTTPGGGQAGVGSVFSMTPAGSLTVLYSFSAQDFAGKNPDGGGPAASLIEAPDGNFYGTTQGGGTGGRGTVFVIAPIATLTTLSVFDGSAGANPLCILQGQDGDFYGLTAHSPFGLGAGTLFRVSPIGGTPTNLYTFKTEAEGRNLNNGLIQARDGRFYGTTSAGGMARYGVVYQITPDGTATVPPLYSFTAGVDGGLPGGGVIQASDGNFYGTAQVGGVANRGTIFRLTPDGTFTQLHSFTGGTDGANPVAALMQASDGSFYGTASREGGPWQVGGTIFRFTGTGDPITLHAFDGYTEGPTPVTAIVEASDGLLWGTTFGQYVRSGIYSISKDGASYKGPRPRAAGGLYQFNDTEGGNSVASLVLAHDGNFYGILGTGGSTIAGAGIIFKITPAGVFLVLHRFKLDGTEGFGPYYGALVEGTDGFLYGVTGDGGGPSGSGKGTFFRLGP